MNKQTDIFYNKFAFFYPLVEIFLKSHKKRLFKEINRFPSGDLLEVGVGNGKHLPLYKTHKIIGIDTSSGMLARAIKMQNMNVTLIQMDGEDLQFYDCYFDYVVLSHVIAVVGNPEKLVEEVYRVLKPNGKVFILNHFTPENGLRHFDEMFKRVAKIFHFRSLFHIGSVKAIKKFELLNEIELGPFSYFKLLILCKD